MIYEPCKVDAPIRQGDIFLGVPKLEFRCSKVAVVEGDGFVEASWEDHRAKTVPIDAVVSIVSVPAIVISQDCDCVRGSDLSLCEIRRFEEVEGSAKTANSLSNWVKIITKQARLNQKWFYLPPDPLLGFSQRMAVAFSQTIRILRDDLESLRKYRPGRLINMADEHFRERLSDYFRRYPYDEWYPLTKDELHAYDKTGEVPPFPWQR